MVSAPAGFGKTVCISEWAESLAHPVAWFSIDVADDDPGRFFTYLIAALRQISESIGSDIDGILRSGQLPPTDVITTTLSNDLLDLDALFVLILDDFHLIQDRDILTVFEFLLANWPPSLHLVLVTREDPPLPLARLRANNQLTEIRAADLRFATSDIEQFLNQTMSVPLSDTDVATLEEKTEGWIAGLQLATLALEAADQSSDHSAFITSLSGSHRFILNYLTEEVLNRQPAEVQGFLLKTAILDRLNIDLCDAVTKRVDSASMLEYLINSNLFVLPQDEHHQWYRYHHLFGDLLRDLAQTQIPADLVTLHQRASLWYRAQGMVSEAIHHALLAEDYPTMIDLIERHALDMLMQWHVKTVDSWIQAIPADWQANSFQANLAFAWLHLLHGDHQRVMPYLSRLQAMLDQGNILEAPSHQAKWLALQVMMVNAQQQPELGLALGQQALDIVPDDDDHVRSLIYLGMGRAYQELDQYEAAVQAYQMIIQQGQAAGNTVAQMLGSAALGLLAIEHGQLHFAFEVVSQSLTRMEHAGSLPPISTALYGELGEIYYNWHQLPEAQVYFRKAIQVSHLSGYNDAELYHHVILSRLYQIRGDLKAAAEEIDQAVNKLRVTPIAAVREEIISQQVSVRLAQGYLAEAEAALQVAQVLPHGGFTLPVLKGGQKVSRPDTLLYLSTLRIALHRIDRRDERHYLDPCINLTDALIESCKQRGYWPLAIEGLLIRAQFLGLGQQNGASALQDVATALELAEPERGLSIFVQEGPAILDMLTALKQPTQLDGPLAEFLDSVLEAITTPQSGQTPQSSHLDPLSGREVDVLRLIAEGLTYQQVADQLFVSLNTVRTHIKTIYSKLQANNRTKAIETAYRLNIL
ncbi:MAG: hypothetical protein GYB68_12135 [Chloroflexi bacterium]|nr:hypothetical protein [Chloroflexota bacterium]